VKPDAARPGMDRREFLRMLGRLGALGGLALLGLKPLAGIGRRLTCAPGGDCAGCPDAAGCARLTGTVWQIDPHVCIHCGRCGTTCILRPSAVKCVHAYDVCGYCDLCGAYFATSARTYATGAENRLCPTGAITRTYVEDPYFQYTIREELCVGCAKCVAGCSSFGNGSMFLQIRHDRCANCNACSAARQCPAKAISRVPRDSPYILKKGAPRA
jgi:Na+-translocating ferredoxin:NAD+ oxidoreductase subunit B